MYNDFTQQDIAIPYYANLQADSLGMDSRELCRQPLLFDQYPPVQYQFNSLGYRTHPVDHWQNNAILILGDSFTLGLGSNIEERYTDIIEQQLSHQVLNFSLNGASNDWISRKLSQLLPRFRPRAIVIHYTFTHRRERPHTDWHDDERTECEPLYSSEQNYANWQKNFENICAVSGSIRLIHSFIHNWHDQSVAYESLGHNVIPAVTHLDFARDGFHYGKLTHLDLAKKITNLLVA
jgi:hypothetical protein